jgi:WD40 repeat protein
MVAISRPASLWHASTGRLLRTLVGHRDGINSTAFSPDGKRLATASDDKSVKIWDVASGKLLKDVAGLGIVVKAVAFAPDGDHIFLAGFWEGQAKFLEWDLATNQMVRSFAAGDGPWQIAVSPSGDQLLSSDARDVKLSDRASGKLLHRFPVINATSFSVSRNGQQILIADAATIKIFEPSGRQLRSIQVPNDVVFAAYSPDEKRIVAASGDFTVRVWDASSGKLLQSFKAHESKTSFSLYSAVLSPDGTQILCSGRDNSFNLWDLNSGRLLRSLGLETNFLRDFALSPKERTVVAGGDDRAVRLWDADTGRLLNEFRGHDDAVKSIAFSPDGERILSSDDSASVRIWNTATGETLKQFTQPSPRMANWSTTTTASYGMRKAANCCGP